MATITNQSKNTTIFTNNNSGSIVSNLFDENNLPFDPDTTLPFQDEVLLDKNTITNQSKNSATITNQNKN